MSRAFYIRFSAAAILFGGCVTEFEPRITRHETELLVVEGFITDGWSVIDLSLTVSIGEDFTEYSYPHGARVHIERSDGTVIANARTTAAGRYELETGELDPDMRYRLVIEYDGEEYVSEFLSPIFTPAVENVKLTKAARGEPVKVRVTTRDPGETVAYYRWKYEQRWEFHTELNATHREEIVNGEIQYLPTSLLTPDNTYYCWGVDISGWAIGAAARNLENEIKDYPVFEVDPSDIRLSLLYYVKISQNAIRKGAYEYFTAMEKGSKDNGGLFSAVPSELKGNITCNSSPDKKVVGFVEVSTTSTMEEFFPVSENIYEPPETFCHKQILEQWTPGSMLYTYTMAKLRYAPRRCVDCTAWPNASKRKPYWWPSENL